MAQYQLNYSGSEINQLLAKISVLESNLNTLETTVNNIDTSSIQSELNTVKQQVQNINDELDTKDTTISNIQTKLTELENTINSLSTSIDSKDAQVLEDAKAYTDEQILKVQTGGSIDLDGYAKKTEIPTKTSQLQNDSGYLTSVPSEYVTETELEDKGYLTEHQDLSKYALKSEIPTVPTKTSQLTNDSGYLTSVPSEYITETELNEKGYLTEHQDISNKADRSELPLENSVKMVAHRGFSTQAPENTIPAYELAGMKGYWGAECDIQQTSDGHFILMHDLTVDRTTNGTGNVADMTLEEIKALNIDITMTKWPSGTVKVPTLEEYLICCKKYNLVPVIEIKSGLNMENFIRIIREHNMEDKCVVISFSNEILISLRALSNIIKIQTLTFVSLDHCLANNFDIDINYNNAWLTENNIKDAHSKGIEINVWTVDNSTDMKNLINLGVDYVTTNRLNINNNVHNRVCTLEDNHIKDEMDITTLKSIYTNSVDFEEMSVDYLVGTVKDDRYKLLYPEWLPIREGSSFRVRSKAFNAMGCLDYKIQYDDVNYKLTIYPFNSNNLLITDLGWFVNDSLITLPKNTKFFVLFCSKATETTFTDDEITTLMNSIKLTRMNIIKDDNVVSEPIHPTVIRYGVGHPSISEVGTESAGSTQNKGRCFDNIKHQIQGNKFIVTFDPSKILMTVLPCNNDSYTDLGWLESDKEYDIPTGTKWILLYYAPADNSGTFSTEEQQAVLNSSIKFKGIDVVVPSKYQTRTDENLNTESKDIVSAINELYSKVLTSDNIYFNETGELVVTIGDTTKTFVPKE